MSLGESSKINYYASFLGLIYIRDSDQFTFFYDKFVKDIAENEVETFKNRLNEIIQVNPSEQTLLSKIKWLRQRLVSCGVENLMDLENLPVKLNHASSSAIRNANLPFMDEEIALDKIPASESRYYVGDCDGSQNWSMKQTRKCDIASKKLEIYNQNRGQPISISIGDVCNSNQEETGDHSCLNLTKTKTSTVDESDETVSKNPSKKKKKKKRKRRNSNNQVDVVNAESESPNVEVKNIATDNLQSSNGAKSCASKKRNRRRKKEQNISTNNSESLLVGKEIVDDKVLPDRPKKRSILSMRKQKAREQCFSANNSLMDFHPISQEMQKLEIKKRNDKMKEKELKIREEIEAMLTEEKIDEIVKQVNNMPSDKKKTKETKQTPKKKKNKKQKKTDQSKKSPVDQSKLSKDTRCDEAVKRANTFISEDDLDVNDEEKELFQVLCQKERVLKKASSGRSSPSSSEGGKPNTRRNSDPGLKPDKEKLRKSLTCSNKLQNKIEIKTCGKKESLKDLSNEIVWPKLQTVCSMAAATTSEALQPSCISYASKVKANIDSVGCSPPSSGEDGHSTASSSCGINLQYYSSATSPNDLSNFVAVQSDLYQHSPSTECKTSQPTATGATCNDESSKVEPSSKNMKSEECGGDTMFELCKELANEELNLSIIETNELPEANQVEAENLPSSVSCLITESVAPRLSSTTANKDLQTRNTSTTSQSTSMTPQSTSTASQSTSTASQSTSTTSQSTSTSECSVTNFGEAKNSTSFQISNNLEFRSKLSFFVDESSSYDCVENLLSTEKTKQQKTIKPKLNSVTIRSPNPKYSQRLVNGKVTNKWNDPGDFDLLAAARLLHKAFHQTYDKSNIHYE